MKELKKFVADYEIKEVSYIMPLEKWSNSGNEDDVREWLDDAEEKLSSIGVYASLHIDNEESIRIECSLDWDESSEYRDVEQRMFELICELGA